MLLVMSDSQPTIPPLFVIVQSPRGKRFFLFLFFQCSSFPPPSRFLFQYWMPCLNRRQGRSVPLSCAYSCAALLPSTGFNTKQYSSQQAEPPVGGFDPGQRCHGPCFEYGYRLMDTVPHSADDGKTVCFDAHHSDVVNWDQVTAHLDTSELSWYSL
jgi:hypothetical protein